MNKSHIKNGADELYKKAMSKTSHVYDDVKDEAELLSDKVKNSASDLYDEGKKKINSIDHYIEGLSDDLVTEIREKPLTSILLAVAVTFILSKLFSKY